MRSTIFLRSKNTRRVSAPEGTAAASARKSDNLTPASVDDHEMYFDKTPRPSTVPQKTQSLDEVGSRPPPTNPEAASLASLSMGLPPRRRSAGTTLVSRRSASPPLRRSSTVPPKINVTTNFWAANEEFERKYDLTPVDHDGNAPVTGARASSFVVDPWEQDGSKRENSAGRYVFCVIYCS